MTADGWDALETALARFVFEESLSFEAAIGRAAAEYPDHGASVLLLAAISHVTHVDQYLTVADLLSPAQTLHHYRVIAALAADTALLSPGQQSCRDLLAFWQVTDSRIFR